MSAQLSLVAEPTDLADFEYEDLALPATRQPQGPNFTEMFDSLEKWQELRPLYVQMAGLTPVYRSVGLGESRERVHQRVNGIGEYMFQRPNNKRFWDYDSGHIYERDTQVEAVEAPDGSLRHRYYANVMDLGYGARGKPVKVAETPRYASDFEVMTNFARFCRDEVVPREFARWQASAAGKAAIAAYQQRRLDAKQQLRDYRAEIALLTTELDDLKLAAAALPEDQREPLREAFRDKRTQRTWLSSLIDTVTDLLDYMTGPAPAAAL